MRENTEHQLDLESYVFGVVAGEIPASFHIVSVLSGEVSSVKDDLLLGGVVELTHDNNIKSYYAGLTAISVKETDSVTQGDVLGKTGTSDFRKTLGNHVHFEPRVDKVAINPNTYLDQSIVKIISDLQLTADESFAHLPDTEESDTSTVK